MGFDSVCAPCTEPSGFKERYWPLGNSSTCAQRHSAAAGLAGGLAAAILVMRVQRSLFLAVHCPFASPL